MKVSKSLVVMMAGLSLGACSLTDEKNTFMTYGDLQDKVRAHDQQWETVQSQLERIDELEAEVAALKQNQPLSAPRDVADDSVTPLAVAPAVMAAPEAPVATTPPVYEAPPVIATPSPEYGQEASQPSTPARQYGVQLASYINRDEAARGWRIVQSDYPTSFDGLQPRVNQKQVNGRTMYQLKVGPFVSKSYGNDFCQMLKNKGKDCLVTNYNGDDL
ncbi:SPOR domain-containing protein [Marinomonas algarum]|uniref:SPOR domain-containing protein n=1 Tax=Marinomonas algarum TaxID=2883105 RepID=A0A9X1INI2_9GAMM|nr:SPOR domain-containing protein [Marinomonas algarum]MCB5162435.1 SPOR domain-containing protein [Marinomonas algarum]